jgi:hypothetical protein
MISDSYELSAEHCNFTATENATDTVRGLSSVLAFFVLGGRESRDRLTQGKEQKTNGGHRCAFPLAFWPTCAGGTAKIRYPATSPSGTVKASNR